METYLAIRETTMDTLPRVSQEDIERALTIGDLAKMPPEVRIRYYVATCASAGLNPMTQPFTPMKNQAGQVVLYANKEAAEQLRKRDRISIRILSREKDDGLYIVTVAASTPDGRCEESQGIIEIANLKGTNLANAMMKCETKAKRRVTMALCGLGFPMDDDYGSRPVAFDLRTGEIPSDDAHDAVPEASANDLATLTAELFDQRTPPDARASAVGQQIDALLTAFATDADAYWQRVRGTYPDLTPGALARVRDHLQAKLDTEQAVWPPTTRQESHGAGEAVALDAKKPDANLMPSRTRREEKKEEEDISAFALEEDDVFDAEASAALDRDLAD